MACVTHDHCRLLGIGSVCLGSVEMEVKKGDSGRKKGRNSEQEGGREGAGNKGQEGK